MVCLGRDSRFAPETRPARNRPACEVPDSLSSRHGDKGAGQRSGVGSTPRSRVDRSVVEVVRPSAAGGFRRGGEPESAQGGEGQAAGGFRGTADPCRAWRPARSVRQKTGRARSRGLGPSRGPGSGGCPVRGRGVPVPSAESRGGHGPARPPCAESARARLRPCPGASVRCTPRSSFRALPGASSHPSRRHFTGAAPDAPPACSCRPLRRTPRRPRCPSNSSRRWRCT